MTKTLTKQWREGKLDEGLYYVVIEWDDEIRMLYFEGDYFLDTDVPLDNDNIKEVLAPVPSYEEYNELLRHSELSRNLVYEVLVNQKEYNELLNKAKEYKRLQERLAIATKALKDCYNDMKYWAVLTHRNQRILSVIKKALKEMEGVK